jgi:hypothetical protein
VRALRGKKLLQPCRFRVWVRDPVAFLDYEFLCTEIGVGGELSRSSSRGGL